MARPARKMIDIFLIVLFIAGAKVVKKVCINQFCMKKLSNESERDHDNEAIR